MVGLANRISDPPRKELLASFKTLRGSTMRLWTSCVRVFASSMSQCRSCVRQSASNASLLGSSVSLSDSRVSLFQSRMRQKPSCMTPAASSPRQFGPSMSSEVSATRLLTSNATTSRHQVSGCVGYRVERAMDGPRPDSAQDCADGGSKRCPTQPGTVPPPNASHSASRNAEEQSDLSAPAPHQ